jgi:hypothetical protein
MQRYFRGNAAMFGGVQYHLPANPWVLKLELDGNDYQHEPQGNNRNQASNLNFGLVYRQSPSIDWSVALERGNTVTFGLTLHAPLAQMGSPKISDPPIPRVLQTRPHRNDNWLGTAADVYDLSGWGVTKLEPQGDLLVVHLDNVSGAHWNDRIERVVAVLNRDAPERFNRFELRFHEQGMPLSSRIVARDAWAQAQLELVPPVLSKPTIQAVPPASSAPSSSVEPSLWERPLSNFGYALVPSWQQNIGGPDGFLLFRIGAAVPMQYQLTDRWWISGSLGLNLFDNYEKFKYDAPSELPRVRTNLREYMTTSRVNIPNLQLTHVGQMNANQFISAYAGYLESEFAGVGAEWLYRPWHSSLAFGLDVNQVQQRSFHQFFSLDGAGSQTGYRVTTGHATVYWDTGWQAVQARLSAGRYLAKDVGATLELSRSFDNGVTMGAWVTKTNISAEQFGEGSFDKGLFLRIPFDVMTTTRSGNTANLVYNPLTRDGGAKLNRSYSLYEATQARSERATSFEPTPLGKLTGLPASSR